MLCRVYQKFYQGRDRQPEAIRKSLVVGQLLVTYRVWDPRPGRSIQLATLVADDGERYLLPAIDRARMEIRGRGILVEGTEIVPRGIGMKNIKSDDYPQVWWCVPHTPIQPKPTSKLPEKVAWPFEDPGFF